MKSVLDLKLSAINDGSWWWHAEGTLISETSTLLLILVFGASPVIEITPFLYDVAMQTRDTGYTKSSCGSTFIDKRK